MSALLQIYEQRTTNRNRTWRDLRLCDVSPSRPGSGCRVWLLLEASLSHWLLPWVSPPVTWPGSLNRFRTLQLLMVKLLQEQVSHLLIRSFKIQWNIFSSGTKLKCPFCERTYGYETNLRAHIRQRHQGIRVPCPYCHRSFTRNNTVRRHIAREHRHHVNPKLIPAKFGSKQVLPDQPFQEHLSLSSEQINNLVHTSQVRPVIMWSTSTKQFLFQASQPQPWPLDCSRPASTGWALSSPYNRLIGVNKASSL